MRWGCFAPAKQSPGVLPSPGKPDRTGPHATRRLPCQIMAGVAIVVFSALVDVTADPDEVWGSIPATAVAMSEVLRRSRLELPSP